MSKKVQDFLLPKSISHQTTAPFTPSQNGFIERDMRTVVESARSMLYGEGLPERLWAEAANTAVYLLNRSVNNTARDKTPYELYYLKKPRFNHLRVLGVCQSSTQKTEWISGQIRG